MELTELLRQVRQGDSRALDELLPFVYEELKSIAASQLRRESSGPQLQATELVHEVYLKLSSLNHPAYEDRTHFYGIASRLMRQVLVDLARARLSRKRNFGIEVSLAGVAELGLAESDDQLLNLHEALNRLEKEHPRKARLIEMRYFGGLTAEDSAQLLLMSVHTVRRELRFAQAWLKQVLEQ